MKDKTDSESFDCNVEKSNVITAMRVIVNNVREFFFSNSIDLLTFAVAMRF